MNVNYIALITIILVKIHINYNYITKAMKNAFLLVISSTTDPILNGIMIVLFFLSFFWFVVLTMLPFKYFCRVSIEF